MQRSYTVLAVALVAACGGGKVKEVDDPQIAASAKSAGEQSAAIAEIEADNTDEVESAIQTLGGSFQSIVSQHQANYAATRVAPAAAASAAKQDGTVTWDGTTLKADYSYDEGGISLSYVVDLTYTAAGDGWTIDGTYDLAYDAAAEGAGIIYDLSATYDALTTDASGCPVSGSLDVSYNYEITTGLDGVLGAAVGAAGGATKWNGRVLMTFNGCDDVTVEVTD